jgi:pimeloyl-ACP methyl ester carboxylesterase
MASEPPPPADLPTLIVLGTESQVPNADQVERYRAALGDRVRVERVHSGHSLLWDAFGETSDTVAGFLP